MGFALRAAAVRFQFLWVLPMERPLNIVATPRDVDKEGKRELA